MRGKKIKRTTIIKFRRDKGQLVASGTVPCRTYSAHYSKEASRWTLKTEKVEDNCFRVDRKLMQILTVRGVLAVSPVGVWGPAGKKKKG